MKKLLAIVISMAMIVAMMPMGVFAAEGEGTEANPYSLSELSTMTRAEYIEAQNSLGGTMYVDVGTYSYDTNGVLGNGVRNDTPGQNPDHSKLNAYGENGYLNDKNDGANGKNIVFVGGTITSGATGYTSIDNIGTSLLLAVPAYTNVTFKNTIFNNVLSFNYQLYTSPWSQLGELKFDGCTFNGIIVGGIAAQTLTFNGCTFNNYTNATYQNSSNPTWIRPAYGNWTSSDNTVQGEDFKSLTTINFTDNKVTSTRPVKFERVAQWKDAVVKITDNTFEISAQSGDSADKKMGVYLDSYHKTGENTPFDYSETGAINLIWENNAIEGQTTCAICLDEDKNDLPPRSKVTDTEGNEIAISAKEWKTAKDITIGNEASVVGKNSYTTLEAAIAAANAGDTVKLLGNVSLSEELVVDKAITIDGNRNTITITDDITEHLIELKANVTIKNITLDSANKAKGVNTYGTDRSLEFIFENVKMLNSKGTGLTAKGGTVTLNNVEVSGSNWKQSVDVSNSNDDSFTNGANLVIDSKCALKDELAIVYDYPENNKLGEITASGWNVAYKDQMIGENEAKYTKRIFTLTKQSTGGGGAVVTPTTDNVTNNVADKNTTADLTPAVSDNKSTTTVDNTTADKIVDKAVENKSTEVIVDATGNNTVASSEVAIPEKTVKEISEKTDANLVIKTDNGQVDLDRTALAAVAEQAGTTGTVTLVVETVKTDENICHVDLKLVTSNGAVKDFKGGNVKVTIDLNKELAAKELVCVYIDDNGIYTIVEGVLNADGTYTFTTGHFSEYAVIAKDEADKVIADQLNTLIKKVNLKVRTSKTSKKNIKAVVSGDVKALTDAGYTVKYKFYRSTKKASKYEGKVTKDTKTYINTVGKKGTKYYYKAKALVYQGDKLVGQTVLTQCKYGVRTWSK